ncbi:MAG: anaerobic carbon-monoxide dehydrogenase catalytic subunit [Elusimicrobiota bacterium]|jgi:carbon-monoxide dehydrogenase catalytic subunit
MGTFSSDKSTNELGARVEELGVKTIFDRFLDCQPECPVGALRLCCRFCSMGPCLMTKNRERSVCGVDKHTVVAWNYARNIAAGVCQHAWHAYYYLDFLKQVLDGKTQFQLKGEDFAQKEAKRLGVDGGSPQENLRALLSLYCLELMGSPDLPKSSRILDNMAPKSLRDLWKKHEVYPDAPMIEIIKTINRTGLGVETDPLQICLQTVRLGIGDLVNEYIVASVHHVIHGPFQNKESSANFGALDKDKVNIVLQGHIPVMPSVIAELASDKELIAYALSKGAKGINVLGVCCTGNELFARYGVPMLGNFSQQELVIATGAVDAYVVEQQCVMPTLAHMAEHFHTLIIATDPQASMPGAERMTVNFASAYDQGRAIMKRAIDNFSRRDPAEVHIPAVKHKAGGSFDTESFLRHIGGLGTIVSAVAEGKIKGIAVLGACTNPRIKHNFGILTITQELIKNDILVLATGCAAPGLACGGMMDASALDSMGVGAGLKEFCKKYGIPPVLMFGSCVYNANLFAMAADLAKVLGCEMSDLPLATSAPEWMNEKLFPIATYMLAAGTLVHLGPPPPVMGSDKVVSIFTTGLEELFKGTLYIEPDPVKAGAEIVRRLAEKRQALLSKKSA